MRHLFCLLSITVGFTTTSAQKPAVVSEILSPRESTSIFNDSARKSLNIQFPILRVYKYSDKSGLNYFVLSESMDEITKDKDTLNFKIKAINLLSDKGVIKKTWEINDNISKEKNDEQSIRFFTKYIEFKDYDKDGLADPIIIYGTSADNGSDDGRIKFIIYYKNQKIAIRHQNGVLDFERETQVDIAFYHLPQSIQTAIRNKMEMITKNNQAIFPAGWQTAMKNKKTIINERR